MATADIDVWYQNPETGDTFGFGLPLPPAIPPQIKAGRLVQCAFPDGHEPPAPPVPEADRSGSAGPDDDSDDPLLYPCIECGTTALKGKDGQYTDHCRAHTAKPIRGAK